MKRLRVYLAGASTPDEIVRVKHWSSRLVEAGVDVVSTWPTVIGSVGLGNPRDASDEQRRHWSAQDLHEIANANVLWLLCPKPEIPTRGAWVELGCAYTRALLIISSGDTRQSIFTALGSEFETDEAAFGALTILAAEGLL